ncbi:hypothetical protein RCO28_00910 [Streptomyces sp. LHD-70]|uniref:hypothetical protein n=1 Tax=Streptomyces sp. LHD-70 TaxID=3072140 RepID=UPI00281006A2|nr:hypothetical protein [Streptomyces sp. LHD-70]MDQ8701050.1 hypothetical protein [Streptomyces sp. LHD-70]
MTSVELRSPRRGSLYVVCTLLCFYLIALLGPQVGGDAGVRIAFGGLGVMVLGGVTHLVSDHRSSTRATVLRFEGTGIRLQNRSGSAFLPWQSLAGVGFHWTRDWRGLPTYTLELCPAGPVAPDDPALRHLICDDEPLHPGMPRLRYRIPANATKPRIHLKQAFQQHAPHLYFGLVKRRRG